MYTKSIIVAMILMTALLTICLLFAQQIIQPEGVYVEDFRNTGGSLTFTVRTVTYGGAYAPRHTGVIWITNNSDQFVKTIKIWAQSYRNTLVRWMANSGNNTTGAITGASLTSHQLHTVTWNGTNTSNAQVADGTYKVKVEFAEHNATSSNMGRYTVQTFVKGPDAIDQAIPNETNFQNMHITWVPEVVMNGTISGTVTNASSTPIQGAIVTAGSETATTNSSGGYSMSIAPGSYSVSCSATNYQIHTQNNVAVTSNQTTTVNFNMGNLDAGILSGLVTNGQNQPISGATVQIGAITTTSNSSGFYSLSLLPGTFSVDCSAPGYQNLHQSGVVIQSNQTTTLNFVLNPTSVYDDNSIPQAAVLLQNSPNPFKTSTTIRYYLIKDTSPKITVFDIKGKRVRILLNSPKQAGWNELVWDGKDDNKHLLPSGKYIIRLETNQGSLTRTTILLK